ncbi:MAG: hypothetical protein J7L88_02200 [Thermoplasmata archaeon]|nr:hypothetical protein [Thermoplasmata archaeon]
MSTRKYKDINLYSCIVLNLLASAIGIDLTQKDFEKKVDRILSQPHEGLTKSEIMHEIRSNHNMTERILKHLEEEGFIVIERGEKSYRILPTKKGLLHVREFNRFYASIYSKQIEDHYRYVGLPSWYRKYKE